MGALFFVARFLTPDVLNYVHYVITRDNMAIIYMLRHSETEFSKLKNVCGVSDPPLSEEGIVRAQHRAHVLRNLRFSAAYSSPLKRCFQTLGIMRPGMAYEIDQRLREINFGELEGRHIPEVFHVKKDTPDAYEDDWKTYHFPGGDNMVDYFERAGETVREIAAQPNDAILLVTHNGFINSVLANLVFCDIDMLFTVPCPTCGLVRLWQQDGRFCYELI